MNQDIAASYYALRKVYSEEAYSNIVINEATEKYPNCSPGFVRFVVKGVLRNTRLLDYQIGGLAKNGLKGMKAKTKIMLRIGLYIIDEMDDMPEAVCVHEVVELAKKENRPNSGFINALLRSYLRAGKPKDIPEGSDVHSLGIRYSAEDDLVRLLQKQYGKEVAVQILEAWNRPTDVAIRNNPLRQSRDVLLKNMLSIGIEARAAEETENGIYVDKGPLIRNKYYEDGAYTIQGVSSQMAIEAFDPKPGQRILDLCAAPGGKSTAAAERMGDSGEVISCDVHEHRTELIRKNADRLGIQSIHVRKLDSTVVQPDFIEAFDGVIADVPCSGLGTISVKPEIKLRTEVNKYPELIRIQRQILDLAWRYVRPGGRILYSTCTINRDENEAVIDAFNQDVSDAVIVEKRVLLPYNKNGFFYCIIEKPIQFGVNK